MSPRRARKPAPIPCQREERSMPTLADAIRAVETAVAKDSDDATWRDLRDLAHRILRADYWRDVRSLADSVATDVRNGDVADRDSLREAISTAVDGSARVIYTGQAIECLLYSDNDSAYWDSFGPDESADQPSWSKWAYFAFEAD